MAKTLDDRPDDWGVLCLRAEETDNYSSFKCRSGINLSSDTMLQISEGKRYGRASNDLAEHELSENRCFPSARPEARTFRIRA